MRWGIMDDEWEERFDDFVTWRLHHGDADVDVPGREVPAKLLSWVVAQRAHYQQVGGLTLTLGARGADAPPGQIPGPYTRRI